MSGFVKWGVGVALAIVTLCAPSAAVASEVLVGNTTVYANAESLASEHAGCYQFTAGENGVMHELWFRTDTVANTGVTEVVVGVESDVLGAPSGTVLAEGKFVGTPSASSTVTVMGFGLKISLGTKYWLCFDPVGGTLHFFTASTSEGTKSFECASGTKLGGCSTTLKKNGPLYFAGVGSPAAPVELYEASSTKVEAVTAEVKALKSVIEGTLKVNCTTGCTGGGTGSEVELTSKAKEDLAEGDLKPIVYLVGALVGFVFFGLIVRLTTPSARA